MFSNLLIGPLSALLEGVSTSLIIDVVFVFILALFAFLNFKKGLTKQVLGIAVSIGSLLIAYFFCDDILSFVNKHFGLGEKLASSLLNAASSNEALNATLSPEGLTAAIASLKLPEFIADFALKTLDNVTAAYASVGHFLTDVLSHYILIAASFVLTWIVARILLGLVKKLLVNVVKIPGLNLIDKVLGLVFGIIKGVLIVYALIYIVEVLPSSIPHMNTIKNGLSESIIGGLMKQYNLVSLAFTWVVGRFKF